MSLAIIHANQLICVSRSGERMKRGKAMRDLAVINDGAVLIEADKIIWTGPTAEMPPLPEGSLIIDATGKTVFPGFVDSHTHLIFAGNRADEFEQRLQGVSYQEIASKGGGINSTVRQVRQASAAELKAQARRRLERMLAFGITTVEVKSGYGLTLADELKCLNLIAELNQEQPCDLVPTFLGAHDVPPEFRANRHDYVQLLCKEMIPAVAADHLAAFCDVFCDQGAFTLSETEQILQTAVEHGLKLKVHADEFSPLGATELAAKLGAISADHLLHVTDAGIQALLQAGTVATLLPGTAFYLGVAFAPARKLIDAGLPVALATDCNPGSCMSENLPLMGTMACTQMKMLPAEVISAMTLNGAAALGLSHAVGSIEPGKQADLVICNVPGYSYLPYHFGVNHAWKVIKSGRVVVGA
jgi:imidazolonepropionase